MVSVMAETPAPRGGGWRRRLGLLRKNVTVEPVVVLYCLIVALSGIPGEELYLKKACRVNLNHTQDVCDDIYNHHAVQIETQKIVSGIQAKNGALKNVPGIIFTLFAGPLSDTYGRKPLILLAIIGYFTLNLVYLINAFWFLELRVEFLMFECLSEVTGGQVAFFLATKCYISDITSQQERTTRFAIVDAFYSVGWLMGLPIGTRIKKRFGYVALFSTTLGLTVATFLYTLVFLKDSVHKLSEERKKERDDEKTRNAITCEQGVVGRVFQMTLSSFRTMLKKRPDNGRTWVIMFVLIFTLPTMISGGYSVIGFLFYRLQYKISTETYGDLISAYFITNIFSQLVVVPFLSKTLKLQDTTIIILALVPAILGMLGEAWRTEVWALYLIWSLFYLLYFNIFTTTRSALSKLVEPGELGRLFTVLGVLHASMGLFSGPLFGILYKATIDVMPGLWLIVIAGGLLLTLVLTIVTHLGIRRGKVAMEELVETAKNIELPVRASESLTEGKQ